VPDGTAHPNRKLIINVTPTGMVPTREMTPHVPIHPDEIVRDVRECAALGTSIAHLHARDTDGSPTWKRDVYGEIIGEIRQSNPDLIVCVSTSGRTFPEIEKRSDVLFLDGPLRPDMASLTLSSLNFPRSASLNAPDTIQELLRIMNKRGIKPELEVFDAGMINYAHYLIQKGMLTPPYYFNVLLGNIAGAQADLGAVSYLLSRLPADSCWALAGIGSCQRRVNALSILSDGHVRVGIESPRFLRSLRYVSIGSSVSFA